MPHHFIEAPTLQSLKFTLNGGVLGGVKVVNGSGKMMGLHGLTLIIRSTTVTFSDATGVGLTYAQVKAAIEAAVAGVTVVFVDGCLGLKHASGVVVDKDGTANAIFGFGKAADITGVVYAFPAGSAPRVLDVSPGARVDSYFAWVEVP
jgi:hypothetical protein